ncbi:MAG: phosphate ABC transporter substrate-binding protein PstS [Chloroflexaceae bacterium]|nr:phosphate ABC transporter substrate-binding protein PstS [Chloroflexaceae bacterium]
MFLRRTWLLLVIATLLAPMMASAQWSPRALSGRLLGAGATFPEPLYQRLIQDYRNVVPGMTINYQGVGSGTGITNFQNGNSDFGGTDAIVGDDDWDADNDLHVPTVMGAVVPTYNLPSLGLRTLRFSGPILERIFRGDIKEWNHADILAENPHLADKLNALSNKTITVYWRADSSGTSSIFTTYLHAQNGGWTATKRFETDNAGLISGVNGEGRERNSGVATAIATTEGAIGYVEYIYARTNRLPVPRIKNQAGYYVRPTLFGVTMAAQGVTPGADLRMTIVDGGHEDAYPIPGVTWILVNGNEYSDMNVAQAVVDFVYWMLQQRLTQQRMGYAPLPQNIYDLAVGQLCNVEVGGTRAADGSFTCP